MINSETSNSGYMGFHVPDALIWETNSSGIPLLRANLGMQAYKASLESQPLTVWLSFYELGQDIVECEEAGTMPERITNLPEGDRNLGKQLYLDCQRRAALRDPEHTDHERWIGVWFKDAVDFDAEKPVCRVVPEGYRYAELIRGVEHWDEEKYVPLDGERIPVEIPISRGAFAVPDGIHTYDQLTGIPKKVEPNREKALKVIMDNTGLTENQAERRLSKVWSDRKSGIVVVGCSAGPDDGPLDMDFSYGPMGRGVDMGSVAASRLPSGARQSETAVPKSEYDSIVKSEQEAIKRAESAEAKLSKIKASFEYDID
ncbi:MAG: hypothetical protein ISS36_03535 [Candidatus Aenigmarchaeota archaeon]|nr:hypothetical protein [Candidatus Aenigmarchaeota archaeon]